MATTNAGAFTVQRIGITIQQDNSMTAILSYTNASTGANVVTRLLNVPANASYPITDQFNNVIAAGGTYATLANAIASFLTQIDTSISSAATGNKLNL